VSERSTVFAATTHSHEPDQADLAVGVLFGMLETTLLELLKKGSHVLVKVNMGCSGARAPGDRYTTHPTLAASVIRKVQRLGAVVSFGDDVARSGSHCETIWRTTGMREVSDRTGAGLLDFAAAGAREVRGSLFYPRHYFVSNAYFQADLVINLANLRSHADMVLSGAIKNMFGMVIGKRKALISSALSQRSKRIRSGNSRHTSCGEATSIVPRPYNCPGRPWPRHGYPAGRSLAR
jgi:uncharacterized protein (DUF362 family)